MDWARAIDRNRDALTLIVATLFAMLRLDNGRAAVTRIPRRLYRDVLRLLRPAESAVRRLIVILARGLVVKLPPARSKPVNVIGRKGGNSRLSFPLFDRRKRFAERCNDSAPQDKQRLSVSGNNPQVPALGAEPDAYVDVQPLCRRLQILKLALDDLPRQAKRLARWRAKREQMPSPKFTSPLRPGPAPSQHRKPVHEVDFVLRECHGLAWDALRLDTS